MKKRIILVAMIVFGMLLTSCNTGPSEEELHQQMLDSAKTQAIEACESAISEKAKYPAAVEFVDPIEASVRSAEDGQGPLQTEYYSVNFGIATFVSGFNVPSEYHYGCVSYHDKDGTLLRAKAEAREKGFLSIPYSYSASSDSLR